MELGQTLFSGLVIPQGHHLKVTSFPIPRSTVVGEWSIMNIASFIDFPRNKTESDLHNINGTVTWSQNHKLMSIFLPFNLCWKALWKETLYPSPIDINSSRQILAVIWDDSISTPREIHIRKKNWTLRWSTIMASQRVKIHQWWVLFRLVLRAENPFRTRSKSKQKQKKTTFDLGGFAEDFISEIE